MFAHGFNMRFGTIAPPRGVDVSMVAPKGPGHRVRETFQAGEGVPALVAVHQDASGNAKATALSYAAAIGAARAGVLETTFAGGDRDGPLRRAGRALRRRERARKAGFETLVEAGYQPEVAYFECLHELKLIVDLMYRGGLDVHALLDQRHGRVRRLHRRPARRRRQDARDDARDARRDPRGGFAQRWIAENAERAPAGSRRSSEKRARAHAIEEVGAGLRGMMPFLERP